MLLGTAGSCWNAGGQWMNRLNRKSSDMLREEERKGGGGMGGQRNFMCNATAERSAVLRDSPAPRQGTKGRLTGLNPISSVTDLTHFVILLYLHFSYL